MGHDGTRGTSSAVLHSHTTTASFGFAACTLPALQHTAGTSSTKLKPRKDKDGLGFRKETAWTQYINARMCSQSFALVQPLQCCAGATLQKASRNHPEGFVQGAFGNRELEQCLEKLCTKMQGKYILCYED